MKTLNLSFEDRQHKEMWIVKGKGESWQRFFWTLFKIYNSSDSPGKWCGNCIEERIKNKKIYEKKYGKETKSK